MARINERQIGRAVLSILNDAPQNSASIKTIKNLIPKYIKLSPEDQVPSRTRNGEKIWEQQVRNIISHRKVPGNIVADGYVDYKPGVLALKRGGTGEPKFI